MEGRLVIGCEPHASRLISRAAIGVRHGAASPPFGRTRSAPSHATLRSAELGGSARPRPAVQGRSRAQGCRQHRRFRQRFYGAGPRWLGRSSACPTEGGWVRTITIRCWPWWWLLAGHQPLPWLGRSDRPDLEQLAQPAWTWARRPGLRRRRESGRRTADGADVAGQRSSTRIQRAVRVGPSSCGRNPGREQGDERRYLGARRDVSRSAC
jgi:hypothetical protein